MLEISPHERRALRAQAHHLHPVVTIGQHGLTPTVLTEIDLALNAHGLIKVRVFLDDRDERELLLAEIADGLDAAPVQHIGKLFVLWRPQPEPAAEPAKVPRPKRGKTPSAKAREANRKATKGLERVGRRARGAPHVGAYDGIDTPPPKRPRRPHAAGPSAAKSPPGARKPATAAPPPTRSPRTPDRAAPRGPSAPNPRRRRTVR
jgi:putative YhbY family RNA-binding protein